MSEEFFKANNYVDIKEDDYNFAEKNIVSSVFSYLYQKGIKKVLIEEVKDGNIFKLEKEKSTFIKYDVSPKQNEKLYQYFSKINFNYKLNDKNEEFKIIKNQVMFINNILEPVLNDLEIEYRLYVAGGALRDHLFNRQIKDLDIVIEFNDKFQVEGQFGRNSADRTKNQLEAIEKFFIEKDSMIKKHNLKIFHGQSREKFLHEIVFQTMNKINNVELKEFFWEDIEKKKQNNPREQKELTPDDSLIYDALFSVIKAKNHEFKYPMDLLLNSNIFSYVSSFDFEICKCSYKFKKAKSDVCEENQLFLTPGFISDMLNSKLSLNIKIFGTKKQVDRCLSDHYLRLKKKYPEHEIQLINISGDTPLINYIEKAHKYFSLEDRLQAKDIKTKVKKI